MLAEGEVDMVDAVRGTDSLKLGDVIGSNLDRVDLMGEVMLYKVLHLCITGIGRDFVEVIQLVIHKFLKLKV